MGRKFVPSASAKAQPTQPWNWFATIPNAFRSRPPLANLPFTVARSNPDAAKKLWTECTKLMHSQARFCRNNCKVKNGKQISPHATGSLFKLGIGYVFDAPLLFSGQKIPTSWQGKSPYVCYRVKLAPNSQQEIHADQLKRCLSIPSCTYFKAYCHAGPNCRASIQFYPPPEKSSHWTKISNPWSKIRYSKKVLKNWLQGWKLMVHLCRKSVEDA